MLKLNLDESYENQVRYCLILFFLFFNVHSHLHFWKVANISEKAASVESKWQIFIIVLL